MAMPMFLHYRLTDQSAVLAARKSSAANHAGDLEPITEIDILYGGREVRPMWDYEAMDTFISGGPDDEKAVNLAAGTGTRFGSRLAVRRTSTGAPSFSLRGWNQPDETPFQPSRKPRRSASATRASSRFSRPRTCTSASAPATAGTSTQSASVRARSSVRTSTRSSGSRPPSPSPSRT